MRFCSLLCSRTRLEYATYWLSVVRICDPVSGSRIRVHSFLRLQMTRSAKTLSFQPRSPVMLCLMPRRCLVLLCGPGRQRANAQHVHHRVGQLARAAIIQALQLPRQPTSAHAGLLAMRDRRRRRQVLSFLARRLGPVVVAADRHLYGCALLAD